MLRTLIAAGLLLAWYPAFSKSDPSWLTAARYDILAKAAEAVPPDQLKLMLQQLLVERCNRKVHHESRELATQTLVVGKNGPKFPKTASDGPPALRFTASGMLFQNYSMSRLAD